MTVGANSVRPSWSKTNRAEEVHRHRERPPGRRVEGVLGVRPFSRNDARVAFGAVRHVEQDFGREAWPKGGQQRSPPVSNQFFTPSHHFVVDNC